MLFDVFRQHLLSVMEITMREISRDLVVIPGARVTQLQVLDTGNESFKDHVETPLWLQSGASTLSPMGKRKPNARGFVRGLGKRRKHLFCCFACYGW